jgi:hypothetical protein
MVTQKPCISNVLVPVVVRMISHSFSASHLVTPWASYRVHAEHKRYEGEK